VPRSKNKWSYTSIPQYTFIALCSVKAQGQLYLLCMSQNPVSDTKNIRAYAQKIAPGFERMRLLRCFICFWALTNVPLNVYWIYDFNSFCKCKQIAWLLDGETQASESSILIVCMCVCIYIASKSSILIVCMCVCIYVYSFRIKYIDCMYVCMYIYSFRIKYIDCMYVYIYMTVSQKVKGLFKKKSTLIVTSTHRFQFFTTFLFHQKKMFWLRL
jgi:hypothetical protein